MLRANAIKTSGGIEINWIDIPYDLLKQATERIEKKKGTCKFLPCARFQWQKIWIYPYLKGEGILVKKEYCLVDGKKHAQH
jgi:hypothetical protein